MRHDLRIRDRARDLRRAASLPERRLWAAMKELNRHGCHFRRQVPIGPWFVDFAWVSLRLVIELDGDGHVGPREETRDRHRDRSLREQGYIVLRFWNTEVSSCVEGVAQRILSESNRLRVGRGLAPIHRD